MILFWAVRPKISKDIETLEDTKRKCFFWCLFLLQKMKKRRKQNEKNQRDRTGHANGKKQCEITHKKEKEKNDAGSKLG